MNDIRNRFEHAQSREARNAAVSKDRLQFHLMPPVGWLNDPNGLFQKDGEFNIYYQYAPESPKGNTPKGWGHYTTRNWIEYQEQEVPLFPDSLLDEGGAYSGSALVHDHRIYFFYTGNRKLPGNYDYINEGRQHWTIQTCSDDGIHFENKHPVMKNVDYPSNLSCHVRDPKVWKDQERFLMVLGARTKDSKGQVEVFESKDLENWVHLSTITPKEDFGYMWECPDLFTVDGHQVLITCPQGIEQKGIDYESLYQNGWFNVQKPLDEDQQVDHFHELDHGFDFYAPQSFEDESGRRILIGWMGLPDVEYTNREEAEGWKHALTLPRKLSYQNGILYQYPIEEIFALRKAEEKMEMQPGISAQLPDRVCEIELYPTNENWTVRLRKDAVLSYQDGILALKMEESGHGRDVRHVRVDKIRKVSIFSDTSSLEIFINDGEAAMTTRIYDDVDDRTIESSAAMEAVVYPYRSFVIKPLEID